MNQWWEAEDMHGEAGPSIAGSPGTNGRRAPGRILRAAGAAFVALALVGSGYGIRAATTSTSQATAGSTTGSSSVTTASDQSGDVASLVQRAERAVVRVTSSVVREATFFSPQQTGEAVGTGFVVGSNGLILTNYHVVEGAQSITVTLSTGKQYSARVLKSDAAGDLAVLKIDASGLATLSLGSSSTVQAGESVVAIGYALGLEGSPTVTSGIVSSTGRTIQVEDDGAPGGPVVRTYRNVLQISAAINSGNSGGPLLDLQGRVIGIDTAGAQGAQNIGFAIPIDQARSLLGTAA
jgi:S1-C subfamily serine protease